MQQNNYPSRSFIRQLLYIFTIIFLLLFQESPRLAGYPAGDQREMGHSGLLRAGPAVLYVVLLF